MSARRPGSGALVLMLAAVLAGPQVAGRAQEKPPPLDQLKKDVIAEVEKRRELTQQMVDSIFSFSELGFQEIRDAAVHDRHPREGRIHRAARRRRHSDVVGGEMGIGQAGHLDGDRHRRHADRRTRSQAW